jgi:DNA-binding ferritin-like protein (Dps family)
MQKYIWTTGVASNWTDSKFVFESLLDMLEDAAADGRKITDVTGSDVAAFLDELKLKNSDWKDKYREKLNKEVAGK